MSKVVVVVADEAFEVSFEIDSIVEKSGAGIIVDDVVAVVSVVFAVVDVSVMGVGVDVSVVVVVQVVGASVINSDFSETEVLVV